MKEKRIEDIIKEYLSGVDSEEGKALFTKWYDSFDDTSMHLGSLSQEEKDKIEQEIINNIKAGINERQKEKTIIPFVASPPREGRPVMYQTQVFKFAAVLVGIFLLTGLMYNLYVASQFESYTTAYGETKTLTLPDQSVEVLNGNSTLKYETDWTPGTDREVWLDGEGFFSVVHTQNHNKFTVRTAGNFNIQVLGTKFNVYNRDRGTRVVLNSGKVQLNINENESVILEPGELLEFKDTPKNYVVKKVNPGMYSSWTSKELVFKNTSIREIAFMLEDVYGMTVKITDEKILDQKVSGSVPSDNLSNLLFGLSESFDIHISKDENQLTFKRNLDNKR